MSFLKTVVARVRAYLDEPDLDAKYTDAFLVQHVIQPVAVDVTSRLSLNADNPILNRLTINIVQGQECYQLPPCVGEVWGLRKMDANGNVTQDWEPKSDWHRDGPGWVLEGSMLCLRPFPSADGTVDLWYVSNGDALLHYSVVGTLGEDLTTLSTTGTTLGLIDRRPSAYVGHTLRLIPTTGSVQERTIATYSVSSGTPTFTVRRPFDTGTVTGANVIYEVAPPGFQGMVEAIAAGAALKLATYRKATASHVQMLQLQYRSALKTITDNLSNLNQRRSRGFDKDTFVASEQQNAPWPWA